MNILLLILLCVMEAAFVVWSVVKKTNTKEWKLERLILNVAELVVFLFLVLFPGINFGMRFTVFIFVAGIRILLSVAGCLLARKKAGNGKGAEYNKYGIKTDCRKRRNCYENIGYLPE